MACSYSPPPAIIRVKVTRVQSGKSTEPDRPRPLSASPAHPSDRSPASGVNGWLQDRPQPSSPRNRADSRSPSARQGIRWNSRPRSSPPGSHLNGRPLLASSSGNRSGGKSSSSRPGSRLDSRPSSSRPLGLSSRRPPSSQPANRPRSTSSATSKGLVNGRHSPSRPQSPGKVRSPLRHHNHRRPTSSGPGGGADTKASSWSHSQREPDELQWSPRSPSPGDSESSPPRPEKDSGRRRHRQQGQVEARPVSSQAARGGRFGSSSGSRSRGSRKKERPWTAPVAGKLRCRENIPEEYHRDRTGAILPDQYSDETKRKQEEIIRRILEEFDLEETKKKYRNSNLYVFRRDGKSLADFRFRSELIRMMGSEEIRLNDHGWSRKLQQRLREDYERQLDEQEQLLANTERQRLHRLRVEGILHGSPEDSGLINGIKEARSSSRSVSDKKNSTHARASRGKESDWCRLSQMREQKPIFSNEECNERERKLYARRQESIRHAEEVQSQMSHMKWQESKGEKLQETKEEKLQETKWEKWQEEETISQPHLTIDDLQERSSSVMSSGQLSGESEDEFQKRQERRRKRYQHLPPSVALLYEEETVSGLYSLASNLLFTTSDSHQSEQKKKTVHTF